MRNDFPTPDSFAGYHNAHDKPSLVTDWNAIAAWGEARNWQNIRAVSFPLGLRASIKYVNGKLCSVMAKGDAYPGKQLDPPAFIPRNISAPPTMEMPEILEIKGVFYGEEPFTAYGLLSGKKNSIAFQSISIRDCSLETACTEMSFAWKIAVCESNGIDFRNAVCKSLADLKKLPGPWLLLTEKPVEPVIDPRKQGKINEIAERAQIACWPEMEKHIVFVEKIRHEMDPDGTIVPVVGLRKARFSTWFFRIDREHLNDAELGLRDACVMANYPAPFLMRVKKADTPRWSKPTVCPFCGFRLKDGKCLNLHCSERTIRKLEDFARLCGASDVFTEEELRNFCGIREIAEGVFQASRPGFSEMLAWRPASGPRAKKVKLATDKMLRALKNADMAFQMKVLGVDGVGDVLPFIAPFVGNLQRLSEMNEKDFLKIPFMGEELSRIAAAWVKINGPYLFDLQTHVENRKPGHAKIFFAGSIGKARLESMKLAKSMGFRTVSRIECGPDVIVAGARIGRNNNTPVVDFSLWEKIVREQAVT